MQSTPKLSVVVPTRNRAGTLPYTIQTILCQDYPRLELVVSDNHSSDETAEVVAGFDDPRLRYVRADRPLSMSESWNFALSHAAGDYITFIGDDDGFLPGAAEVGMKLILESGLPALVWRKLDYCWPNHLEPARRNVVLGQSEPLVFRVTTRRKLAMVTSFREGYNRLPCIYNSIVSVDAIRQVQQAAGDGLLFGGVIPDVHSGFALSQAMDEYLEARFPLTVNGASSMSSGVLQGRATRTEKENELIKDILSSSERYGPDFGEFPSVVSIVQGEFILARGRNPSGWWPRPNWRAYVRALIREARKSKNVEAILASARHTASRKRLLARIPPTASIAGVSPHSVDEPKFFSGRLALPEGEISNVMEVAQVFRSLIPAEPRVEGKPGKRLFRNLVNTTLRGALDLYRAR